MSRFRASGSASAMMYSDNCCALTPAALRASVSPGVEDIMLFRAFDPSLPASTRESFTSLNFAFANIFSILWSILEPVSEKI